MFAASQNTHKTEVCPACGFEYGGNYDGVYSLCESADVDGARGWFCIRCGFSSDICLADWTDPDPDQQNTEEAPVIMEDFHQSPEPKGNMNYMRERSRGTVSCDRCGGRNLFGDGDCFIPKEERLPKKHDGGAVVYCNTTQALKCLDCGWEMVVFYMEKPRDDPWEVIWND